MREAEVFAHAHPEHESLRLSVLGHKTNAILNGVMRIANDHALSIYRDASCAGTHAEDHLHDLRAPRTHQSCNPENFTPMQRKVDVPDSRLRALYRAQGQIVNLKHGL